MAHSELADRARSQSFKPVNGDATLTSHTELKLFASDEQ